MRSGKGAHLRPSPSKTSRNGVSTSFPRHKTKTKAPVDTSILDNCRALILDGAFRPLTVVNWHKAVTLDVLRDVEVLEYYDCFVKTVRDEFPVPAVMKTEFLMKTLTTSHIPFSRRNVIRRDGYCCVYCGANRFLTVDHLVPLSRGGKSIWENTVTACTTCNCRKGNRSLEQLGWTLEKKPKAPNKFDLHFVIDLPVSRPKEWEDYIRHLPQNI